MHDLGLTVEFDGKKNAVFDGDITEYAIGEMICEYARLVPMDLKKYVVSNSLFSDDNPRENMAKAIIELHDSLKKDYGAATACMVITDFHNEIMDCFRANESELSKHLEDVNADTENPKMVSYMLEDTGFTEFGISTIGQALLTAYYSFAHQYVLFRHMFNTLVTNGAEDSESALEGFWSFFGENVDFQHIDFRIMAYDQGFHSIYTIKSSPSLLIFEAVHAMDAQIKFVKCKNCGHYFVPLGRSDTLYCGFPSPQDSTRTCRSIGAQATQASKMKNDTVTQEYRRLYMRLMMGLKRHPEDTAIAQRLEELSSGMKEKRKQRKAGAISADDILEWLHKLDDTITTSTQDPSL